MATNAQKIICDAIITSQTAEEDGERYPILLSLYDILADGTDNISERIIILKDIAKNYHTYLMQVDLPSSIKDGLVLECNSLIHYQEIILKLLENPNNAKDFEYYKAHSSMRPIAELTLYLQHLPQLDIPYYIAYIQGYAVYIKQDRMHPIKAACLSALQVKNCIGKAFTEDILDFCGCLMIGETTRERFLRIIEPNEYATLQNYEITQRNKYFDEYIRCRVLSVKARMDADRYQLYPPTQINYLKQLLEEETQAYKKGENLGQLEGSTEFEKMSNTVRPEILATANLFILYLTDIIQKANQTPEAGVTNMYFYFDNAQHNDNSKHFIHNTPML